MQKFDFTPHGPYNEVYREATVLANQYVKSYRDINKGFSALLSDHGEHPIKAIESLSVWDLVRWLQALQPHIEYTLEHNLYHNT